MAGMFAKVPGTLYRKAYGVAWNRQEIRKLAKDRHPAAREVSQAVLAVLADDFAPEERAAFVRVEALRTSLSDSQEQITLVDYGAGTETETRSPEEMSHGRTATTTIGAICRTNSKPPPWARLLFALIRKLEPRQCLELGTSLGLSAAYEASALRLNGSREPPRSQRALAPTSRSCLCRPRLRRGGFRTLSHRCSRNGRRSTSHLSTVTTIVMRRSRTSSS